MGEKQREREGGREGGRENPKLPLAANTEPDAGLESTEPRGHDLSRSQESDT